MKGITQVIVLGVLLLGIFGLMYVVFDRVIETQVVTFAESNIIDGNQTYFQNIYKTVWDATPVIVVLGFVMFLLAWAQVRRVEEL